MTYARTRDGAVFFKAVLDSLRSIDNSCLHTVQEWRPKVSGSMLKRGIEQYLRSYGYMTFHFLCLAGTIPVVCTNLLPTTLHYPGSENFGWASFEMQWARVLIVATLLSAVVLAAILRLRWELLAIVPLIFVSTLHLSNDRLGSNLKYASLASVIEGYDSAVFDAAIGSLESWEGEHQYLTHYLPPALPTTEWLRQKKVVLDGYNAARVSDPNNFEARATAQVALTDIEASLKLQRVWQEDKEAFWTSFHYIISTAALLFMFLWRFGILNVCFGSFLATSILVSLAWSAKGWWGNWLLWSLAGLYPVFALLIFAVVVRFVFRAYQDNVEVFSDIEVRRKGFVRAALSKAFLIWVPFILFVVGSIYSGIWMSDQVALRIYCQSLDTKNCVDQSQAIVRDSDLNRDTLRDDLHLSINRLYKTFEVRAIAAAEGARANTPDVIAQAKAGIMDTYNGIFKPNIWDYEPASLTPRDCFGWVWIDVPCIPHKIVMNYLNRSYQRPVNRMRSTLAEQLNSLETAANSGSGNAADLFVSSIKDRSSVAVPETLKYLDFSLLLLALLSLLQYALMYLATTRAYLIIVARLLFQGESAEHGYFSMRRTGDRLKNSLPKLTFTTANRLSNELEIKLQRDEVLYVKSHLDVSNANPVVALPLQPLRSMLGRLGSFRYFLKRVIPNNKDDIPSLTDKQGCEFIAVRIPDDGEIAFRWKNFVGMTSSVKLSKLISLKLPLVALGHVILPTIRGPGLVIVKALGAPTIGDSTRDANAVAPYRLLAWETSTLFRIESHTNPLSIYLDECQIDTIKGGQVLCDVAQDGRLIRGVVKNLWGILRP